MITTNREIVRIFVYLCCFMLVIIVAKGISWDKILNPKHKIEGIIISIFIIVAIAYCLGSFIDSLIPNFS